MTPTHKELLDAAADAKFADREQNLRFKIALQSTVCHSKRVRCKRHEGNA